MRGKEVVCFFYVVGRKAHIRSLGVFEISSSGNLSFIVVCNLLLCCVVEADLYLAVKAPR